MASPEQQQITDQERIASLEREIKLLKQALGQSDHVRKQWLNAINELKQTRKALSLSEKMLRDVLDNIPVGVYWKDEQLNFGGCNRRFAADSGVSPDTPVAQLRSPAHWHQLDQQVLQGGNTILGMEELHQHPDGTPFWIRSNRIPLRDDQGRIIGILGCYEDIDARKKIEDELEQSRTQLEAKVNNRTRALLEANKALAQEVEARKQINNTLRKFSSAVEQSGSAVVITDLDGYIQYINPMFTQITGFSRDEAIGKRTSILKSGETSPELYSELWETITAGNHWHGQLYNKRKNGEHYWSYLSISPVADDNGVITHFVAVSEDVTHLRNTQQKMEQLSLFDALTKLPNRRLFRDRLEKGLEHSRRHNSKMGLLFIDIDNFKQINDTLGHEIGDQLLMATAKRLISKLRIEDTVARLGGDEFTVLISDLNHASDAQHIALKLLEIFSKPFLIEEHDIHITCSIGITIAPDDSTDASTLMKNADIAMYQAKESGPSNLRFFTESMNHEISRRAAIEKELKTAIQEQQFELYFQPQIDLLSGALHGAEALIRWHHPDKGVIPPMEFIPIAEESGSILPIGEWVIEQACRVANRLNRERETPILISINLSARQFRDPELPQKMAAIIERTGVDGRWLEMEITETALMDDTEHASQILERLKRLGLTLAIDDFGTGYSSLNYLKRFPVDALKVDRSFVMDIPADGNDMAITAAVLAMASQLRLSVIAEGIETDRQLEFLRQHHCKLGQGFLFSKPIPLDRFEQFIQDNERRLTESDQVLLKDL